MWLSEAWRSQSKAETTPFDHRWPFPHLTWAHVAAPLLLSPASFAHVGCRQPLQAHARLNMICERIASSFEHTSSAAFSVLAWPVTSPTTCSLIPLDWLSATGGLSGTVWLPSRRACAISLANASIAGSFDESRCSLCDPGKLCSFSWNQHCPRHLVSPFTDDQHRRHLFLRLLLSKEPIIH